MKLTHFVGLPCLLIAGHTYAQANNTLSPPPVTTFTQEDISSVSPAGLIVEVPTACPAQSDDPNFVSYPLTIARHEGCKTSNTDPWPGHVTTGLWVNRCTTTYNPTTGAGCTRSDPNPVNDTNLTDANAIDGQSNLPIRLMYFTINDADAATLSQLDWFLDGSSYVSIATTAGIPSGNVYTPKNFQTAVNNGTISMQGWSSTGSAPWTYAVPVCTAQDSSCEYVVMPGNDISNVPSGMRTKIVELDYERADHICDTATSGEITCPTGVDSTVSFLGAVSSLLQNTTEFGGQTYDFNVRGDEIVPYDGPSYATTNTWQSGLDAASIPQIMELAGFNLYGLQLSDNNRYATETDDKLSESWQMGLAVVSGSNTTPPTGCTAATEHVMMDARIEELSFYDFYSGTNDVLTDGPNAWLSTNCVPAVQLNFINAPDNAGGPACDTETPPQQAVWPAIWGALIGEPTSCSGGGRRVKK